MNFTISKLKLEDKSNLPLTIVKSTILKTERGNSTKHFFYQSKIYMTNIRTCNGETKPISKIFNPDLIDKR